MSIDQVLNSSQAFWKKLVNKCVKKRYLKIKQQQQTIMKNFSDEALKKWKEQEDEKLQKYMLQMQFFQKKYQTCCKQGIQAQYPHEKVRQICQKKIIKFIRLNDDIL